MALKLFFEILNGNYDQIPSKDKQNMVRIFLNSTISGKSLYFSFKTPRKDSLTTETNITS